MPAEPLRVMLDSGDPERRERLARLLTESGHIVVGEERGADVRLVDLSSSAVAPPVGTTPALILTDQPAIASDASVPGVLGRAAKGSALDAALRSVAAGLQVRERGPAEPRGFAAAGDDPPGLLTPRELQILAAVGDGLSNKAVARRLGISAHTVKFHLEAVFAKLEVTSRAEAVAKGLRRGLIEL